MQAEAATERANAAQLRLDGIQSDLGAVRIALTVSGPTCSG